MSKKPPAGSKAKQPKQEAGGIAIHCAHDRLADPASLKPNGKNPNRHPEGQIRLLVDIIRHSGWRAPIVVSRRSGLVVVGHGRLEAALLMGATVVPVNDQQFASDEEELEHMVADNRLAELAEIDNSSMRDLLKSLPAASLDFTGFDTSALDRLILNLPTTNTAIDEQAMAQTRNECPKCGFKW